MRITLLGMVLTLVLGATSGAEAQQPQRSAGQLRVDMASVLFDSLSAANASLSPDGRQVLLELIDRGVATVEGAGLTAKQAGDALEATRILAGGLVQRARLPNGSVRLGEMTRAHYRAATQAQQQALEHQLARDAPATGAQRGPDGDLPLAAGGVAWAGFRIAQGRWLGGRGPSLAACCSRFSGHARVGLVTEHCPHVAMVPRACRSG